jgi:hypothetical protein
VRAPHRQQLAAEPIRADHEAGRGVVRQGLLPQALAIGQHAGAQQPDGGQRAPCAPAAGAENADAAGQPDAGRVAARECVPARRPQRLREKGRS